MKKALMGTAFLIGGVLLLIGDINQCGSLGLIGFLGLSFGLAGLIILIREYESKR